MVTLLRVQMDMLISDVYVGVSTDDQQLIQLPPSTNYIRKPSSQCYISPVVVVHQNERSCLSNLPSSISMLEGNSSTRMTAEDQLHLDPRIRLVAWPSTTNIEDKPWTAAFRNFATHSMEYRSAKKKTKQCMVINNLLKGVMLNIDLHILLPKRWLSDVTGKDDASCNTR
ncbi:unnamed protein product [Nippostrongylus brasiliensis]|uniref:Uncharacterized protein n=1 Tax=Nippostrongylus brasiliensis TaxID=27835 RepID=A0A0N4XUW0_NIPBR|nr:unnamed protein product [Nippostrongylus brasiliensis]